MTRSLCSGYDGTGKTKTTVNRVQCKHAYNANTRRLMCISLWKTSLNISTVFVLSLSLPSVMFTGRSKTHGLSSNFTNRNRIDCCSPKINIPVLNGGGGRVCVWYRVAQRLSTGSVSEGRPVGMRLYLTGKRKRLFLKIFFSKKLAIALVRFFLSSLRTYAFMIQPVCEKNQRKSAFHTENG